MKTARFLASQMTRLHQAGVRVYMIRGNHDAMSRIAKQLVSPDTATIFGGRCQSVIQPGAGMDVAFHGLSFASPKAPESLLPPAHGRELSTSASCTRAWPAPQAMTSTHASTLVMPGIPQGRDINEAGEKSVTLVTIRDERSVEIEERLTSVAQFERVSVDLTGALGMERGHRPHPIRA